MCLEAYVSIEDELILRNKSKNVIIVEVVEQKLGKVQQIVLNQNEIRISEY